MKIILRILLFFISSKEREEGGIFNKHIIEYKMLFGKEYIIRKYASPPPKTFNCRCEMTKAPET